jgi:4-diphosphocytidyl-2-C-methyl-D-erythritol kinase
MLGTLSLYLAVGDRRKDGYHDLTTVFHAVSLADEVTMRDADVLSQLCTRVRAFLADDQPHPCWPVTQIDHPGGQGPGKVGFHEVMTSLRA